MKKSIALCTIVIIFLLVASCGKDIVVETMNEMEWSKITAEKAKEIIDHEGGIIILDVRSESEYNEGHIGNSILIPVSELENKCEELLKEKDQKILVYCRSGNRSARAASILSSMGYTQIYDFGGINNWRYEIEK